ncbi:MAG: hypothetical protein IJM68_01115 [Synergistaceae bacterium]|nr:hypothetical protein [Synergistaceae bacterium]
MFADAGVAVNFRREKKKMIAIAVVIALGISYGIYGMDMFGSRKYRAFGIEAHQMTREQCYKLADLKQVELARKFSPSERLIGVLKQGIEKQGKFPAMKGGE